MAHQLRVTLEIGPKSKKVAAVAPDWPGLERGAKTGEAAIARVQSHLPRYGTGADPDARCVREGEGVIGITSSVIRCAWSTSG
jgi:hypothetical protein